MPEFLLFRLQIYEVPLMGVRLDRDPLDHLQPVAFEPDDLFRVVRHQPHLSDAKVDQYLRAYPVIPQVGLEPELDVRLDCVEPLVLKLVCLKLVHQADAPSLLPHVKHDPLALFIDYLHRRVQLLAAVAPLRTKDVAGEAFGMHPHKDIVVLVYLALYERKMDISVDVVGVGYDRKFTAFRRQLRR